MENKWRANGEIIRNHDGFTLQRLLKAIRFPYAGRFLGLPFILFAVMLFVLFTVLYFPDIYERSMSTLKQVDIGDEMVDGTSDSSKPNPINDQIKRIFQRALPIDVQNLLYQGNKITPLTILELDVLNCLSSSKSCKKSQSLSVYRFGVTVSHPVDASSIMHKIVSEVTEHGWITNNVPPFEDTVVFVKDNLTVLLSILEKRRNYWYIYGTKSNEIVQEPPHAFVGLELTSLSLTKDDQDHVLTLNPVDFYIWQWPRSTFLECNQTSASYLRRKYPNVYEVEPKIKDSFVDVMAYFRDLLLKYRVTPLMAGGTVLGWYRECGLIPDTTDVDFMFPSNEWRPEVEKALQIEKFLSLYWILGKPEESLEISVYNNGTKIDAFAMYQERNGSWIGGMIVPEKAKLRWWFPRYDRFCTADLKGHLFHVRCDFLACLKADFGSTWYEPHHNDQFVWYSSHNNVQRHGHWKSSEWRSVFRTFNYAK